MKRKSYQKELFAGGDRDYHPRPVAGFNPRRIFLAKGSAATHERRAFVESVLAVYPEAEVMERPDVPHNRIDVGSPDKLESHRAGKHTLVLGEHKSAVRFNSEEDNTCPNYWHFSLYGSCPYRCRYCYLAGTPGVWFSPTVKVFVNLDEILSRIDAAANRERAPTAFYHGKLQDGLALDPLTGYSGTIIPFFAGHPYARLTLLTKSADVDNLLGLDHGQHTILSWTVNPEEICGKYEQVAPPLRDRIKAMKACADAGYPVRAIVMPLIPVDGWRRIYNDFLEELLSQVRLERITLGGICIYPAARGLMERKLGKSNRISCSLAAAKSSDGRARYPLNLRAEMYGHLVDAIRRRRPGLQTGLCLEEKEVFERLGLADSIGKCNCVL